MSWRNESERHRLSALGIKTTKNTNLKKDKYDYNIITIKNPDELYDIIQERMEYWEDELNEEVYVRAIYKNEIDGFMLHQSVDFILPKFDEYGNVVEMVEGFESKKDVEELFEYIDLPDNTEIIFDDKIGYGIVYDGVNSTILPHDLRRMGYMLGYNVFVIFKGEYKGVNLYEDGNVVKPTKILEVIK